MYGYLPVTTIPFCSIVGSTWGAVEGVEVVVAVAVVVVVVVMVISTIHVTWYNICNDDDDEGDHNGKRNGDASKRTHDGTTSQTATTQTSPLSSRLSFV